LEKILLALAISSGKSKIRNMKTMRVIHRLIRFRQSVLCALCVALCSCGNVFSSMSEAGISISYQVSSLLASPLRNEYALRDEEGANTNYIFTPATDLTVFALYPNGAIREVPIEEVTIFRFDGAREADEPVVDSIYFTSKEEDLGEWRFVAHYGGKSAQFAFYVRTHLEEVVAPEDSSSGAGIDIGIKWGK
jgi:hypothetical protein